jgi:hypothetical protein
VFFLVEAPESVVEEDLLDFLDEDLPPLLLA